MKSRWVRKLEGLGQKAAQVQQVVEAAPAQVARVRAAVAATAGQVQDLRTELEAGLEGLRATDEERLLGILRELHGARPTLAEAGFDLVAIDLEMGLGGEVQVRLLRTLEVPAARLRGLVEVNTARPALHALLQALLRATDLAAQVKLEGFEFREVVASVGTLPRVQIGWRPPLEESPAPRPAAAPPSAAPAPDPWTRRPSILTSTPLTPRPVAPPPLSPSPAAAETPVPSVPESPTTPVPSPTSPPLAARTLAGDWRASALDRFKKMPDLGRRH